METQEAITTRRMTSKVKKDVPDRSMVADLISAAVCAPNHHRTQPWRFIVLTGQALEDLGEAMASRIRRTQQGDPDLEEKVAKEKAKPLRAPLILTVIYVPSNNPKAIEVEDRYAVGAAVQNVLLSAHDQGLGAFWRTGPATEEKVVKDFLGLKHGEEIAGFVYLGYPMEEAVSAQPRSRPSAADRISWLT